jgi:hypothetical protein
MLLITHKEVIFNDRSGAVVRIRAFYAMVAGSITAKYKRLCIWTEGLGVSMYCVFTKMMMMKWNQYEMN